jgi:DNA helicase HerA-like ATPase
MATTPSQFQRSITAAIYLVVLFGLFRLTLDAYPVTQSGALFWFYSGALMIILGRYFVEPYFTTPADAVVNGVALLVALNTLPVSDSALLIGYRQLWYYGGAVVGVSLLAISLKDFEQPAVRFVAKAAYRLAATFGRAAVLFSVTYWLTAHSFFGRTGNIDLYVAAIALWICLTFFDLAGKMIAQAASLVAFLWKGDRHELGQAIGCDNPLLYKVEVDHTRYRGRLPHYGDIVAIEMRRSIESLGMVVGRKHLLNKSWLSVYMLTDTAGDVVRIDLRKRRVIPEPQSVFTSSARVFWVDSLDEMSQEDRAKVQATPLYAHKDAFVGYVTRDSNINTVNFIIVRERDVTAREISEGTILRTGIYGEDALYQVINGNTREEHLQDFDSHGFIVGIARKLGKYNSSVHELETRRWMPSIYSPLFFAHDGTITPARVKQIAGTAIGRLPATDLEVRLADVNAIVTHNTAILGILGIGKSCLAYEVIKRVSAEGIKVVCIDITNEYKKELPPYLPGAGAIITDDENAFNSINAKFNYVHTDAGKQVPDRSGNVHEYKAAVRADLSNFLFGADDVPSPPNFDGSRKVRIYNVDYHRASKGDKIGYNVLTVEMTQAEKTRVIAEQLFKLLMKIPLADVKKAKVLLVFEEAHSLIPEWNSVASEGDKNATNGTAKVILQGRKYGLGSMVITQRTANVSKSILNQCNTIFAMRVFDDTGRQFLENYIGGDYAATLPTLEERHAIAIGKGLRLKQPVIIQLNDKNDVI